MPSGPFQGVVHLGDTRRVAPGIGHRVHRRVSEGRKPLLKHQEKNKFNKCFPYFKIGKCFFNFPGLNKGKIKETLIKSKRKFENIYHFPSAERLIKFVLS